MISVAIAPSTLAAIAPWLMLAGLVAVVLVTLRRG